MVLIQILKRRDASSIIVAIVAALVIANTLQVLTAPLAEMLSGLGERGSELGEGGSSFQADYLYPVISMVVQFLALELLARLAIFVFGTTKTKK